jgi:hypothetical protein
MLFTMVKLINILVVHKGNKITLLPLTSNEIMQCDRVIAKTAKREYEI